MTPHYWSVSVPVELPDGVYSFAEFMASDETQARLMAMRESYPHGSAIVTNHDGWVATYVNGKLWHSGPQDGKF